MSTLAGYDPRAYEPVAVTVDIVALTIRDGELLVLLVERGEQPFPERLALPGGFVRTSRNARGGIRGETPDEAAARELAEETGLVPGSPRLRRVHLEQLATFGAPRRDPRMRVVLRCLPRLRGRPARPVAGGDAAAAGWVRVDEARRLAFDHNEILADGLERARQSSSTRRWRRPSSGRVHHLRSCGRSTRRYGARIRTPATSTARCSRCRASWWSAGAMTERGGERGGPRARLYRAGRRELAAPGTAPAGRTRRHGRSR